jgi:hypothetical protein
LPPPRRSRAAAAELRNSLLVHPPTRGSAAERGIDLPPIYILCLGGPGNRHRRQITIELIIRR